MPRFILKWRYIKSGSPKHGENLVKYIATREGVEKCDESWKHQPATKEQQRLIKELINDFPDSAQSFEYQDYIAAQTKSTASEFISRTIEDNVDLIGKKENYVGYIAMRPRVEKQGSHGLFTQRDQEIDLPAVSKEVAEHEGAVWTTIMSLRREDAEKLGYDNAKAWRDLLRGQANKLAKAMGKMVATDVHVLGNIHDDYNREFMAAADILFLSDEAVGDDPYGFLAALEETYRTPIIVMGRGSKGALMYLREDDRFHEMPAAHVGDVVNTVGAGDALFSAFLHFYAKGLHPVEALRRAQIFAAAKIRVSGASKGFVTEQEVEQFCIGN